jgi:hypothetical protein
MRCAVMSSTFHQCSVVDHHEINALKDEIAESYFIVDPCRQDKRHVTDATKQRGKN